MEGYLSAKAEEKILTAIAEGAYSFSAGTVQCLDDEKVDRPTVASRAPCVRSRARLQRVGSQPYHGSTGRRSFFFLVGYLVNAHLLSVGKSVARACFNCLPSNGVVIVVKRGGAGTRSARFVVVNIFGRKSACTQANVVCVLCVCNREAVDHNRDDTLYCSSWIDPLLVGCSCSCSSTRRNCLCCNA